MTGKRQEEEFFSEEKNQKTFASAQADSCRPWPERWRRRRDKNLLVLFFRKNTLSHAIMLTDEDNVIRAAARREARASVKKATLTPLVIRAIREACGLSQKDAARVFGGGLKAFEKYESGQVGPSSSMTRLLLLAARRPDLFQKGAGMPTISDSDASLIRETVRKSSVDRIYERIYNSRPDHQQRSP